MIKMIAAVLFAMVLASPVFAAQKHYDYRYHKPKTHYHPQSKAKQQAHPKTHHPLKVTSPTPDPAPSSFGRFAIRTAALTSLAVTASKQRSKQLSNCRISPDFPNK
jgi:hypothetical protein